MAREEKFKETYNPCDECNYSYSKNNQESSMCKICEFKKLLEESDCSVKMTRKEAAKELQVYAELK